MNIIEFCKHTLSEVDFDHSCKVARHFVINSDEYHLAMLHDILENNENISIDIIIDSVKINTNIVEALQLITRDKNDRYFDYIKKVNQNSLARSVKLVDLEENLKRCSYSLQKRYIKAVIILQG